VRLVAVLGASDPWGRPLGPMEMRVVRCITGAPTGSVTTEICRSSSSSSPSPSPDGPMTMGHGPMQPGWDNPNRGWHTTRPDDPFDGRWGPRKRSIHRPVGGMGRGQLQHSPVWRGRRRRWWWICRDNRLTTVALVSTVTATTWASDLMQERIDDIGNCI
jgi:hypothetical protein